jgi:hypothetical protein
VELSLPAGPWNFTGSFQEKISLHGVTFSRIVRLKAHRPVTGPRQSTANPQAQITSSFSYHLLLARQAKKDESASSESGLLFIYLSVLSISVFKV